MTSVARPGGGQTAARPAADLAASAGRARTPARPGPGPIADDLVRRLEVSLTRRVGGRMTGDHRGRGLGEGLELDRLRPYEPGDDVRRIDWNATARSLTPQVREDVPDRQMTAWLLLDQSASMQFGTADRRKADVAEGAALVVGRFVARRTDRLGVITFGSGERESITPPAGGRVGLTGLLRALDAEPADEGGGPTSMQRALRVIAAARTSPGLVVVISDFRGAQDWRREMSAIAGRHTVLAIEITDPREETLVDVGELTLIDPETGRTVRIDTGDRRLRSRFDDAAAGRACRPRGRVRPARRPPPPTLHRRPLADRVRARPRHDWTNRMNFLAPILLLGLLLVPVLVGLYLLVQRRRTRYAVRFTNLDLLANLAPKRPSWRRHVPAALYLVAISFLVDRARPADDGPRRARARTRRSSSPSTSPAP